VSEPTANQNKALMIAMGSKTGRYDPEPPDQWRYEYAHGVPKARVIAWVKSKTTGHKEFDGRSPFCISEHGTPLTLKHMADDLGWTLKTAQNVAGEVHAEGRIRLEKGGRIFFCADVAVPQRKKEDDDPNSPIHGSWSTYIVDSIRNLSPEKRAFFEENGPAFLTWKENLLADAMASVRIVIERVEDTMLRQMGIVKKRIKKTSKVRGKFLQLTLFSAPEFVYGMDTNPLAEFVQNGKSGLHSAETASHKPENPAAPISVFRQDQDPKGSVGRSGKEATDRPTAKAIESTIVAETHNVKNAPPQMPSPKLCGQIALAMRGVPIEVFALALRARKWKPTDTLGLCESIAEEAIARWRHGAAERDRQTKHDARLQSRHDHEDRKVWEDTLADDQATKAEKQLAREMLARSAGTS
jgi:hypothetical protein